MRRILFSGDGSSGDLLPMVLMAHEFKDGRRSDWREVSVGAPMDLDGGADGGAFGSFEGAGSSGASTGFGD